ncbi:unnamed protein product [Darwinula stevensoni]|uniref:Uncharacterized protein n=1 Tax=Darwinula stevensoni TaxID=69355 RepID=A0A7R9AGN0_9CRUS|nr:unnamed protein product [Darwinula stevensoni]CAG0904415.1 unnamed protein product [Darwinula stevensoni]
MSSAMEEFPFHILPQLTKLKRLDLTGNLLKRVPALASPSLEILIFSHNEIERLDPGWSIPHLVTLSIKYNPMTDFPPGLVEGMRKLTHFDASGCNLGPTLSKGSLTFQSEVLSAVSLKRNEIVNLERGAITGLRSDTELHLEENMMTELKEDAFLPMLEDLGKNGKIFLSGNPIECDSWLAFSPNFQKLWKRLVELDCKNDISQPPPQRLFLNKASSFKPLR